MNRLGLSVFLLAGLAAVARAEPSADASRAIEADLARARAALARRDTSAVLAALDEAMRHVSDADGESLRALIAFEDRFRDALAGVPASPPPDQPAPPVPAGAPPQSPLGPSVEPAPAPVSPLPPPTPRPPAGAAPPAPAPNSELRAASSPPPAPPSRPPAKTGVARPRAAPAPERDAWSQRLAPPAQQLSRPAPGAEPWRHEDHGEALGTAAAPGSGLAPKPPFRTAPQPPGLQAAEPGMAERQPGPNGRAANGSGLRLLGYYAQDESGRWVWLPAGSENAPPAPPAAPPPPPR
jgi:hypothetical protein